ncbi:amidohydrolase family protein [Chitinophaga sp. LS1]|uniref:amidohydrolase family protein n=1 Tax=Chitinophaga sp. LS1 TaxID=3051176 RepID=UPI002AABC810|nr:amidohydrolase family protein [Chitinophaga sp. LS1]WPV66179.1 amidohydrolase family protein [Chitinophaga sp. LS1]
MKSPCLLLAALCLTVSAAAQTICIAHVNMIDVKKNVTLPDQTIIITKDRIVATGPANKVKAPADATVIDGTGKYIMPGMTDAHIHFFQSGGLYTRPDAINLTNYHPYQKDQDYVKANLSDLMARYLACGITSVIDVGGPMANFEIRDRANSDSAAPTTWVTGPLVSTYLPQRLDEKDPPIVKVTSPEEAKRQVQKELPYKPDFIKIWYIVYSRHKADSTLPIVKAAIAESHANGLKVAVHATQYETAKLAVAAGADILVHSVDDAVMDGGMLKMLKDKHILYIPTLRVMDGYYRAMIQRQPFTTHELAYSDPFMLGTLTDLLHMPEAYDYKAARGFIHVPNKADTIMATNLKLAQDAGVLVAAGTDAGNIGTMHASSFLEDLLAMQKVGLSNAEIIKDATLNAAIGFGKEKDYGSIEKGKIADLILLEKDPLLDLNVLGNVSMTIHNGKIFTKEKLLPVTPEILAQQQLNAYNAGNLEAFLAPYSDSVKIYDQASGKLLLEGKEAMRKSYGPLFKAAPELHCQMVKRIVAGNTVVDEERVTGIKDKALTAVVIYTIDHDKIVKVAMAM